LGFLLIFTSVKAQSKNYAGSIEIVCRTFRADIAQPENITFKLYPESEEAYAWDSKNSCVYHVVPKQYSYVNITGNKKTTNIGFTITHYDQEFKEYSMRLALNRMEIYVNDEYKAYFLYDNRDCRYYSNCPDKFTQDITILYDVENNKIWYIKNANDMTFTDDENPGDYGWKNITNSRINIWKVYNENYSNCPLNFNEAPKAPMNFNVSGYVGQNPRLTWSNNNEPDLAGYKIYRKIGSEQYYRISTVNKNINSYIDNKITVSGNRFDPFVCYKITAYDLQELESNYTQEECVQSNSNYKLGFSMSNNFDIKYFKINEPYPNPFNQTTLISFQLPEKSLLKITIFNLVGMKIQELVNEIKATGYDTLELDASSFTIGIYYLVFQANNYVKTKKIILLK